MDVIGCLIGIVITRYRFLADSLLYISNYMPHKIFNNYQPDFSKGVSNGLCEHLQA